MKSLTFNQLQLRVLVLLFFLFTSGLVSYKYFIELPKLERSISHIAKRELETLTFSIKNQLKDISKINSDYAIWTSTYNFMRNHNQEYIDENLVNQTFSILEVDGLFYINEELELIFGKGVNHRTGSAVNFSFYDFNQFPSNIAMLPKPTTSKGSAQTVGFLTTQNGPAIYSINQIRTSELDGEHRGFLITVKLITDSFTKNLSEFTLTNVSLSPVSKSDNVKDLHFWHEKSTNSTVKPFTTVLIGDVNNLPVAILKIKHSVGSMPNLINQKSLIFLILLSSLFYMIYQLISLTIIIPVKKLARDIKMMDKKKKYTQLNEKYTVKELTTVSKNVNELLLTVQKQNELLAEQVNTDQLTQVMNRHGLEVELAKYKNECIRHKIGFIIIMCDIDHFKKYNDHFGHVKGDKTLYFVAQALKAQCKRTTDTCARFGGEEFILLFDQMTTQELENKMQAIVDSIEKLNIPHPKSSVASYVTVSLGATVVQPSDVVNFSLSMDNVIKSADKALYQAKSGGRNQFVVNYFSSNR